MTLSPTTEKYTLKKTVLVWTLDKLLVLSNIFKLLIQPKTGHYIRQITLLVTKKMSFFMLSSFVNTGSHTAEVIY